MNADTCTASTTKYAPKSKNCGASWPRRRVNCRKDSLAYPSSKLGRTRCITSATWSSMAMAAALWQHVALGHLCQSLVFSSITLFAGDGVKGFCECCLALLNNAMVPAISPSSRREGEDGGRG